MPERHKLKYQEQIKQEKVKHKTSTSNIASGDVTQDCIPDSDDDSESVKIMSTEIPEQPRIVNYKTLRKEKALRKLSLHEKTAASVLLKLFISGNE